MRRLVPTLVTAALLLGIVFLACEAAQIVMSLPSVDDAPVRALQRKGKLTGEAETTGPPDPVRVGMEPRPLLDALATVMTASLSCGSTVLDPDKVTSVLQEYVREDASLRWARVERGWRMAVLSCEPRQDGTATLVVQFTPDEQRSIQVPLERIRAPEE
jgi:hypothetical protein|uniref:Uncharacterized protein n=1 Tax=Thermorudis peleae TaxID=1382356 RepID=A0A831TGD6_9BACT